MTRRGSHLFPHFPHALHTIEQVAAPQQLAPKDRSFANVSLKTTCATREEPQKGGHTVPMLGTAISGSERRAPMATAVNRPAPSRAVYQRVSDCERGYGDVSQGVWCRFQISEQR